MNRAIRPLRILVTDAHKLAGLGAVRSLGRAGHTVVAACPLGSNRHPTVWSRYCSDHVRNPDPRSSQFEFKDWLRYQGRQGTFDAVLPITEASIVGVASIRKELPREMLLILPSDKALEYTLSKFHSTRMALSLGIDCPTTVFVSDGSKPDGSKSEMWDDDFSKLEYPILIKTDNYQTREGAYYSGKKFVARNAEETNRVLGNLEHLQTRIIAQQLIPGSGSGAFLLRFAGQTHLRFAHQRLHEVPYTGGASSLRESYHDAELVNFGESMLEAIGYEGVAMVEFRRRASDGKPYFLEINGRLWGSLALALHAGIDFPKALIECYQNGKPTTARTPYQAGIRCRNIFPGELAYLVSVLRAKTVKGTNPPPSKVWAIGEFFALSLNPMIRHDWFWWSDPLPGLVRATGTIAWFVDRVLEKGLKKLKSRSMNRLLKTLRSEHLMRSTRADYFGRPLNHILFLCYGNIIRSPFAECYWNSRIPNNSLNRPTVTSAGFHPRSGRNTPAWIIDLAAEHKVDLTSHHSRVLTKEDVESADVILVMDRKNYQDLMTQYPTVKDKLYFLGLFSDDNQVEITDPYNGSTDDARKCLQRLAKSLDGLMSLVFREG